MPSSLRRRQAGDPGTPGDRKSQALTHKLVVVSGADLSISNYLIQQVNILKN